MGRSETFFVRHYAKLQIPQPNQNKMNLCPLMREEYNPFGFIGSPMITTERFNNFIFQLWRVNRQLLSKMGKVGGYFHIKFPLDDDVFNYFKDRLIEARG